MIVQLLLIALGFALLIKGADWLVDGASTIAKSLGVSDIIIGLTIVSFGTSAPEIVVNAIASINHNHDMVLGNVIGSCNINLLVVLGISGLISPLLIQKQTGKKEIPILLGITLVMYIIFKSFLSVNGVPGLTRVEAFISLFLFGGFLFYIFKQIKSDKEELELIAGPTDDKKWKQILLIVVGITGLTLGGNLVESNAVKIAEHFGVSQRVIGLTIVALGTSLPEMATSVVAAIKKNNDIAVGNIIGSNIFNLLSDYGHKRIFIHPIEYSNIFDADLLLLIGGTAFMNARCVHRQKIPA
jgi:cation:H+ antiporter